MIDPQKDWQCVSAQTMKDGAVLYEARTTLRQVGETWFPQSVQFFKRGAPRGRADCAEVILNHDAPAPITFDDFQIDTGTNVFVHVNGVAQVDAAGRSRIQTLNEYGQLEDFWSVRERVHGGQISVGSHYLSSLLREQVSQALRGEKSVPAAVNPSNWEILTADFIATFDLADPQADRAWKYCRVAQKRSEAHTVSQSMMNSSRQCTRPC